MIELQDGESAKVTNDDGVTKIEALDEMEPPVEPPTKPVGIDILQLGKMVLKDAKALDFSADFLLEPAGDGVRIGLADGTEPPIEPPPTGDVIDVREFGARDGQDSTDAWQNAIDSVAGTGKTVIGHSDDTYIFSNRGKVHLLNRPVRYCVKIPDDVQIDGRGCTIKLANGAAAYCFTNHDQSGGTRNVDLVNFRHDGNRANQPGYSTDHEEIGFVGIYNFEDWLVEDIQCREIRTTAGRFLNGRRLTLRGCSCDGCDGDAWSIGLDDISRGPNIVYDSVIDNVSAENCRQNFRDLQGNNVIASVRNTDFKGLILGKDCAGGFKIQGQSKDVTVERSEWHGPGNGTTNSGLKKQGNQNSPTLSNCVQDVRTEYAESTDCVGEGLRLTACYRCHTEHYVSRNNGGPVDVYPDVRFANVSEDNSIGLAEITDAKGHGIHCHGAGVRRPKMDKLISNGCAGDVVANHAPGCDLEINEMECRNSQRRHVSCSQGSVHIKLLRADKDRQISGNVTVDRFERL